MMRHAPPLIRRGLGCSDIEFTVNSYRVAADDLSSHSLRQVKRERTLPARGGPENHDQERLAHAPLHRRRKITNSRMRRAITARPSACCRCASIADIVM